MESERNMVLSIVCNGLADVCNMLSKQKDAEDKILEKKLKIIIKANPKDMNIKMIKGLMRKKKENYKKHTREFKKKAKIFKKFARLHELNVKEETHGKNKI